MVRLALRGNPALRVSTVEMDRPGPSYSVDTLRAFHERMPKGTRLVFLLGLDAFREIHTWKDFRSLFSLADFGVFVRRSETTGEEQALLLPVAVQNEFCYSRKKHEWVHSSGNRVRFLKVTALDISASAIRRSVRQGRSIRYLVPPAVEAYIRRQHLYIRSDRRP